MTSHLERLLRRGDGLLDLIVLGSDHQMGVEYLDLPEGLGRLYLHPLHKVDTETTLDRAFVNLPSPHYPV